MMETVFELSQARKSFGAVHALSSIDLQIARGERVALIGASGSVRRRFFACLERSSHRTVGRSGCWAAIPSFSGNESSESYGRDWAISPRIWALCPICEFFRMSSQGDAGEGQFWEACVI